MKQIYAILDPNACTGCRTCELACEARTPESEAILGAMIQNPQPPDRIYVEAGYDGEKGIFPVPIFCHHCEDAPCMKVCPTDAISKNEDYNAVILDQEGCIGCRECMMACPFGALTMETSGKMVKCDLCIDRLNHDEEPSCVVSCPQEILKFIDEEEYLEDVKQDHVDQIVESMRYVRERTN
jgi:Fe-S-cluster-containing dehydrogenase component